jgi:hypothetical protein
MLIYGSGWYEVASQQPQFQQLEQSLRTQLSTQHQLAMDALKQRDDLNLEIKALKKQLKVLQ